MYHISRDKRSEQSAELIYRGLLKCLEKKPFDQVSVTDVQRASGVARTTIYRSFDNLSDVLYWQCDLCFRQALHIDTPADKFDERKLMYDYFAYWVNHSDILKLLIDINRQDIIYESHIKNAEILEKTYGKLDKLSEKDARYFMAIRTGATISILKAWLDQGAKETADELIEILKKQLGFLFDSFAK